jgi:hypothetical protein
MGEKVGVADVCIVGCVGVVVPEVPPLHPIVERTPKLRPITHARIILPVFLDVSADGTGCFPSSASDETFKDPR